MPIIRRENVPGVEGAGLRRQTMADGSLGAKSVTVLEVTVAPGAKVPLHTHPGHEECMVIMEGTFEWVLGDETGTIAAGNSMMAPQDVKHSLINNSNMPAKVMAIFPTTNVQRQDME